jgi:hypothetical protein
MLRTQVVVLFFSTLTGCANRLSVKHYWGCDFFYFSCNNVVLYHNVQCDVCMRARLYIHVCVCVFVSVCEEVCTRALLSVCMPARLPACLFSSSCRFLRLTSQDYMGSWYTFCINIVWPFRGSLTEPHNWFCQKSMRYRSMRLTLSRVRRVTRWLKGWFCYSIFSSELGAGALGNWCLWLPVRQQMETEDEFLAHESWAKIKPLAVSVVRRANWAWLARPG